MASKARRFFAPQAWIAGAWARDVLLAVDDAGLWSAVEPDAPVGRRADAIVLDGPVLPGLVDAHSHAFQRAIAGLTERTAAGAAAGDDFWSWRDRMYSAALRITPDQLERIAAMLYAELLAGGYTQVCEFHYLHNAPDGQPPADPAELSLALVRAARRVGIGLTLLPTLYMRSGFGAAGLRDDQRRFASSPDRIVALVERLQREAADLPRINVGVALHSLRAADAAATKELAAYAAGAGLPVHIHVAEQVQEVQDCIAHTGRRPIEWLLEQLPLDRRWNLVHATHASAAELRGVAASGAAIVICPSTEANLGDGVFDYPRYAQAGGRWAIGSDSHVTRCWSEELRLLEYAQRLTHRRRNVAAQAGGCAGSAAVLFEAALAAGGSASGRSLGAIAVGHRADFLVLDGAAPALVGMPPDHLLDALVFSSPDARFLEVRVGGATVVMAGREAGDWPAIRADFAATMRTLWS